MEAAEDVVIVGAGLAGLAVALGLHRKGVRSLVLESSPSLRTTGFAVGVWRNAFQALDVLGVSDKIRRSHVQAHKLSIASSTREIPQEMDLTPHKERLEIRCVRRDLLLQALEEELPTGTIRYSSRIVSIEGDGDGGVKLLQLADGSVIKAKVLVGCDGINSVVAKWLGLATPSYSGRVSSRGFTVYPDGHGLEPTLRLFVGHGFRSGIMACNDTDIHWFFNWSPTANDKGVDESPEKMKRFVLDKLRGFKLPAELQEVIHRSDMGDALTVPLRFRSPLSLAIGSIARGNVCVTGDALHPMTPDLAQGGCAALEDGVVLARCLGDALLLPDAGTGKQERIEAALREYARVRRWRSVDLVATAYVVGFLQSSRSAIVRFLRDRFLSLMIVRRILKMTEYDCGTLEN